MATPLPNGGPLLFLSHAGADTEATRRLKARLEAAGLRVWFDKNDLRAGEPWQDQLAEAIKTHANAFAVYVGSKGIVNWVGAEVRLALSRAMTSGGSFPFVPIIAAAADSAALPGFAQQFQAVRDVENKPDEFQKLLAAVLGRGNEAGTLQAETDPFFGLRAIDEERSHLFFGREQETAELVKRLRTRGLLMVVGDSGSGKSSLVKAGLVPRWRGGAVAELEGRRSDEEIWHVIELRTGRDPRRALGEAVFKAAGTLGQSAEDRGTYLTWATGNDSELRRQGLRCGLPPDKTRTLIVVDQFEELVTQTPKEQRQLFINLLLELAEPGDPAFSVVLTMRRDYYNLLSAPECRPLYDRLEAQDRAALYRLGRMTDEGLRRIVTEPLQLAGIGPGERKELAESLLRDVGERPGDLALVQFALTRAWERRGEFGGSIVRAYAGIGRVDGALAREAERVFKDVLGGEANEAEVAATLIRLARLEGTAGPTRRVARRWEFSDSRWTLLQTLADVKGNRLVLIPTQRGTDATRPETSEETAEIAHEALLTRWPQLHAWLNEAPEDKRTLDRLTEDTSEWTTSSEDERHLARGADLEIFLALRKKRVAWLSDLEDRFVQASQDREQAQARRAWWLRNFARTVAAIFLIAAGLATWFWWDARQQAQRAQTAERTATNERDKATMERDRTRQQLLAMQARRVNAEAITPEQIERAAALAVESIRLARKGGRPIEADAIEVSRNVLNRLPLSVHQHGARVTTLAVLPDGRFVSKGSECPIKIWPGDGRDEPVILQQAEGSWRLVVLPHGRLATRGEGGEIKLWPKSGAGEPTVLQHGASISFLDVLPDGRLVSAGADGLIKLWSEDGTSELSILQHGGMMTALAVLPDGRLATAGQDGQIKLWPRGNEGEPIVLHHRRPVTLLRALPGGGVASGNRDGQILLWPEDGSREPAVLQERGQVSTLTVLPDGRLASGSEDGWIKIWTRACHRLNGLG